MKKRDIILLSAESMSYTFDYEKAIYDINNLINFIESTTAFLSAYELVQRNRITHNKKKVSNALKSAHPKPFYFVINLN